MKKYELTEEENQLVESVLNDEWKSTDNLAERKQLWNIEASNTLNEMVKINVQLRKNDWFDIETKSAEYGIPTGYLVSMLLHQFATGKLKMNYLHI